MAHTPCSPRCRPSPPPPPAALTAWWVLAFMWLKFATVWRFCRLAALADGQDPPENMRRCFAANYDVEVRPAL